jgi:PPOX class probable F420-dependent enzyme
VLTAFWSSRKPLGVAVQTGAAEAELLGRLGCGTDAIGGRVLVVVRQDDPDMHAEIVLREQVRKARVARLATVDPDGRPHLVPIVFVLEGETLYAAVDAKPKRSLRLRRVDNARERPDVTVLIDHYEDDWERLWWIKLRGRARVLDAGEEADRGMRLLADKYEQYRRQPPGYPVLAIDVREWRGWDASASA